MKNDDNGDVILCKVCDHYNLHDYKEYFGLKYSLVDENGDHEIVIILNNFFSFKFSKFNFCFFNSVLARSIQISWQTTQRY